MEGDIVRSIIKYWGEVILYAVTRELVLNVCNFMTKWAREIYILFKLMQKRIASSKIISLNKEEEKINDAKET